MNENQSDGEDLALKKELSTEYMPQNDLDR